MKTKLLLLIITIFASNLTNAQNINKSFEDLHSVIGTWKMETKRGMIYESWQKINDSTLKGSSYKLNGQDTIILEQVELVIRNGKIMYIPSVTDQNKNQPVVFKLANLENGTYTFENKKHDFPQRIIYNLPKNNTLHAWIEGDINGQFKKSDYNFVKL